MGKYIALQSGDWSTLSIWGRGTNVATRHASTTLTITTNYTAKFTAPDLVSGCVGAIFMIRTLPTSTYSYTITLQENEVDTSASVTISGSLLTSFGAFFAKFVSPYTFTSLTANYYRFKIVRSGSGSTDLKLSADSGGTLPAFQAVDSRTPIAKPTTGDDIWVIGGNQTDTVSVIMSGTNFVGSGTDTATNTVSFDQAVYIGTGGLLLWDTVASATLICKGWIQVNGIESNPGELRIGTSSVPYPAANKANLIFDNYGTSGKAGFSNASSYDMTNFGKVQLHGSPNPDTTNWKTVLVSGVGTVADPIVVSDAVDWNTDDEVIVTSTTRNELTLQNDNELLKVTKVNATTYSLIGSILSKNFGFEAADFAGWTRSGTTVIETSIVHDGAKSAKLTGASSYIYQDFYVKAGAIVTLKYWTRGDGTNAGRIQIYRVNSPAADIVATKSTGVTGTTWTEVTETFTVPAGCYTVRVYLHSPDVAGGIAYFDDLTMTYPGLMCLHDANKARVLNITRNVTISSIGGIEAWGGSSAQYSPFAGKLSGQVDFDWVRFDTPRTALCGSYSPGGPYYHAVDYCVFTNIVTNNSCGVFNWLHHGSYAAEKMETYTGNIAFLGQATNAVYNASAMGKNFTDCFAIQQTVSATTSFRSTGETVFTRCCSISAFTGDNTSGFGLAGSGIVMTDCEIQSCFKNPILIEASTQAIITRLQVGNKGGGVIYYPWDIQSLTYSNLTFRDCIFNYPIPNTGTSNTLINSAFSSEWKIQNYGGVGTNVDIVVKQAGYRLRTGTGLTDTTSHNGGYASRFQSISSEVPLSWTFDVPTGNIQNKTMTVAVWCKINSANYYSGTYQLPRLSITYDNETTVYSQALPTTDWQLLSCTFTPATTFGQISVMLSTMTDQLTSNAYVYFDDFSVLYPAGVQLNLGSMDIWADGNPVTPPISTSLSALDVWTASILTNYGANTFGEFIKALTGGGGTINPEDIRAAIGMASANLDTQLANVQADLDNPDQYKADISGLALEATLTAIKGPGWTDETLAALKVAIGSGGLTEAQVRTALGLSTANLDTQLSGINAKTTNLPADPASESLLEAAIGAIPTVTPPSVIDIRQEMDTNSTKLTAINSKTANLTSTPADEILLEAAIAAIPTVTPPSVIEIRQEMDANSSKLSAIISKTANLPSDPADESLLEAAIAAIPTVIPPSAVEIRQEIDNNSTKLSAISLKTNNLPMSPAAVGSAMTLTSAYDKAKDDVLTPLAVVNSVVDAIKVKTDIMPSVNDITVAVWGYATRTLSSFGTIIADIWSYVTRTLTSGGSGGASAIEIRQEMDANSTQLAKIDALPSNVRSELVTIPAVSVAALEAGDFAIYAGDSIGITITGLGSLAGIKKVYFTVKAKKTDPDTQSLIQVEYSEGLLRINKTSAVRENGSIQILDAATGEIRVYVAAIESVKVPAGVYYYDVKVIEGDDDAITRTYGEITLHATITKATS